jgi:hypothetical protein
VKPDSKKGAGHDGKQAGSSDQAPDEGPGSGPNAAGEGRSRDRDPEKHGEGPRGSGASVSDAAAAELSFPAQTPLFHAQHAERYARQSLIRTYEEIYGCRLIVMIDVIFPESVTLFEELIFDADPAQDLHLMLDTPGGDGETAIRLIRAAQARCRELTIIVPNQAKSAGTIMALGAHRILMGPASDLGPVDPQFMQPDRRGLYSAKDLIAAVKSAEKAVTEHPDTYPLHAAMLADVTAVMLQQARSALARSDDLMREALCCNSDRSPEDVKRLAKALKKRLIDMPTDHGAVFGPDDAKEHLPVESVDPTSDHWRLIWMLWTKYFALDSQIYEGRLASHRFPRQN